MGAMVTGEAPVEIRCGFRAESASVSLGWQTLW
jgi:hypothetical protein